MTRLRYLKNLIPKNRVKFSYIFSCSFLVIPFLLPIFYNNDGFVYHGVKVLSEILETLGSSIVDSEFKFCLS